MPDAVAMSVLQDFQHARHSLVGFGDGAVRRIDALRVRGCEWESVEEEVRVEEVREGSAESWS